MWTETEGKEIELGAVAIRVGIEFGAISSDEVTPIMRRGH